MSSYCAPCLADLALLRESVTTVSGTAACVAHAVLLLHPGDTAPQRLARLSELRGTAEAKMATASTDDVPALELLIQEYALAGAMDMTVPLRDLAGDRTPRPPKSGNRRNRGRDRERGPRPERVPGDGPQAGGTDESPSSPPAGPQDDAPAPATPAPAGPSAEAPATPSAEAPAPPPAEAPAPPPAVPSAAAPTESPSEVPAS
ncbi:MAG: hypothetical protein JWP14_961 [Frankiales bacterium]|nr:hypothetical protein [Frankiales bacterium]